VLVCAETGVAPGMFDSSTIVDEINSAAINIVPILRVLFFVLSIFLTISIFFFHELTIFKMHG
jgi:biopolymer transport protein ExbD